MIGRGLKGIYIYILITRPREVEKVLELVIYMVIDNMRSIEWG